MIQNETIQNEMTKTNSIPISPLGIVLSILGCVVTSHFCKTLGATEGMISLGFVVLNIIGAIALNNLGVKLKNLVAYGVLAKFGKSFMLVSAIVAIGFLTKTSNFLGLVMPFMVGYGIYLIFDSMNLLKVIDLAIVGCL